MKTPNEPDKSIKEKITKLLELINIKTVYYVDDENNLTDFPIEYLNALLRKLFDIKETKCLREIKIAGFDPDFGMEEALDFLKENWTKIKIKKKIETYNLIESNTGTESLNIDFKRAQKIKEYIPDSHLKILSPIEWEEEKKIISTKYTENDKALVLFDEDLKLSQGKFETIKGSDLIVEIKKTKKIDNIRCTLLTHKTSIEDELKFRDKLIEEKNELSINDFFPLSKARLDTPELFGDGIKKTLINSHIEEIKKHSKAVIISAYKNAIEYIEKFDTYDFEDTIVKSSINEGIWEPETLVRISNIHFENDLKQRMVETDYAKKVNKEFKELYRYKSNNFNFVSDRKPFTDKYKLRHSEFYDNGEFFNKLRKPIENGDIFKINKDNFILVAQPCDLMVRGRDDSLGMRLTKIITLLKIENKTYTTNNNFHKDSNDQSQFVLPYFSLNKKDYGVVNFNDSKIVDVDLLDLCVFNAEGECKFDLDDTTIDLDYLSTVWVKRLEDVRKKMNSYNETLLDVKEKLSKLEKIECALFLREFYPHLLISNVNSNENYILWHEYGMFNFLAKRTYKVKEPLSSLLLQKYSGYLFRTAEPHDYAK